MLHIASKAFAPARIPFPVMHVDTGLNFESILAYRDRWIEKLGLQLVIASVEDAIQRGLVQEEPNGSRNRIQTPVLLEAAEKNGFDALFGGGRRDEEKARAKERVFSFRDEFGQWDPKNQRPEIWNLYNGRVFPGQSIRVFPLSNWTELDIWTYIAEEGIEIPELYLAADREVVERAGMLYAVNPFIALRPGETPQVLRVRYRTVGDANLTAAVVSDADTVPKIVAEIAAVRITERGATRGDDKVSAKLRWKTARRRATSSGRRAAAVCHGRFRGRRQEHAHRAAAVRLQVAVQRPACRGRAGQPGSRQRLHRPRAADRRPARRARAGHHDRRRLSLLRHPAPQVHHRGHPGPHPVHPEHGHGGLDCGRRAHPARRPQGDHRAEPAARVPRHAAGRAPPDHLRQQDGPGRVLGGTIRGDPGRVRGVRDAAPRARHDLRPDLGPPWRQRRGAIGEHALVRGRDAAQPPRADARGERSQLRRRPLPRPVRRAAPEQGGPRLPRLCRHHRLGRAQARRPRPGPAERPRDDHRLDRDGRRAGRRGLPADGGHDPTGRRHRPVPRRHAVPAAQRADGRPGARRPGLLDGREPRR